MFHPLWPDAGGGDSPSKDLVEANRCPECPHGLVIHSRQGSCHAEGCLCGWTRDMTGALFVKATGRSAFEVRTRKRYRGAAVGNGRRARILRNPCYFCGEQAQTIDHFYPRAKGGKSDDTNLVAACYTCNGLKSDRTYEEMIAYCVHLRVMASTKTALRTVILFRRHKIQSEKILARHERRLKEQERAPLP